MKRYADDYELVVEVNEKGKEKKVAVYRGIYYSVSLDEPGLKKFRRNSLILFVLMIGLHIYAGTISSQGMYRFFVVLPYVFAFLPFYFLITGILRLPAEKRKYRRDETGLSFRRIKKNSLVLLIAFSATLLGELIFLVFFNAAAVSQDYLFLILEVVAGALSFILFQMQKGIKISEETETGK